MYTKEELANAYDIIQAEEKRAATQVIDKVTEFKAFIDDVVARFPEGLRNNNSALGNFLNQLVMTNSNNDFNISNIKNVYGLNPPAEAPVVAGEETPPAPESVVTEGGQESDTSQV